jgi:hypothetical protein
LIFQLQVASTTKAASSFIMRLSTAIFMIALYILWSYDMKIKFVPVTNFLNTQYSCISRSNATIGRNTSYINGWQPMGHTYEEQIRLRNMSTIVALQSETIKDNVPTVPCISADGHLLVLSVAASRVRYGVSLTFLMVIPSDTKRVLPKERPSKPISSNGLSLWCIFDDGSVTPAYSRDSIYGSDSASVLDCPLSSFAIDQLWKYNETLRVHLASTTDKDRNVPILKAFVNVPKSFAPSLNSSYEQLTLCTSPLHNQDKFLIQWLEFHRLVGFRRFAIYNATDTNNRLSSVLNVYAQKYPNLVDVIQWNFSPLGLTDVIGSRYFQVEALHDCLIRYGDQSEWLGMIDLDEYIVPLPPYETVLDYLHDSVGRRKIGSVNLWSLFYCTKKTDKYTPEEEDLNRLTIERFVVRAPTLYKDGRQKYLYRPRFVQYLTIHHQIFGLPMEQSAERLITLAHYPAMSSLRIFPGCRPHEYVNDTSIRDRFASKIKNTIGTLTVKL